MFFFLLGLIILCCYGIHFVDQGQYFPDYLSKDNTSSIKGAFLLLIFASHCAQYVPYQGIYDGGYMAFRAWSGQTVVAMFLFYSGYGIYYSINHKGFDYVRSMPARRILRTLIHFWVAVIIFIIVNSTLGLVYPLKTILLAFTAWEPIGNSNWYIFVILLCYLLTFIGFFVIRKQQDLAIILVSLLMLCAIIVLHRIRPDQGRYYNTIPCYMLGLWYGRWKDWIESRLLKRSQAYFGILSVITIGVFAIRPFVGSLRYYLVWTGLYALMITLITMKVQINNKYLQWVGDHLFEMYIIQRIPMRVFATMPAIINRTYVFTILCFVVTIVLTEGLYRLNRLIDGQLFKLKCFNV